MELHIKSGEFHHGYLLAGDFESSRKAALEAATVLLDSKENLIAHPDFFHQKFDLFGIKDSQELKLKASMSPFIGEKKVFVAEIFSFSLEAANALLKIFEEPPKSVHFFIIVSSADNVLATLRSRLTIVDFSGKSKLSEEQLESGKEFLKAIPSKRLDMIKKMLGKDMAQNKKAAIELLDEVEAVIYEKIKNSPKSEISGFHNLEEIQKNREFLFDRSPSVKMILEHLALTLPQIV